MLSSPTAPAENDELHHLAELIKAMPGREAVDIVLSDQIMEFCSWLLNAHGFDCLHRVRRAWSVKLDRIANKAWLAVQRRLKHFHSDRVGGRSLLRFMWGNSGWNEDDHVKSQAFQSLASEDQMRVVNWIECATEDADLFQVNILLGSSI